MFKKKLIEYYYIENLNIPDYETRQINRIHIGYADTNRRNMTAV